MDQKIVFRDVSPDELRSVEGGSWFSDAFHWVCDHLGFSGKDMSGNTAGVISVKGHWRGNP